MSDAGEPEGDARPGVPDLGGLGDLGGLLESAQAAFSAQAQAAQEVVEGSVGGGVVRVEMTGAGEVRAVMLAPEVVDPDEIELLQDLIVAALHDAAAKVTALQREALGAFADLDLGGLGGSSGPESGGPGAAGAADEAGPGELPPGQAPG
jgi:DNA-binding YbaB/EbfC family protein